ncbi:MAG TPA: hypothetical protein PLI77_09775 [Bacteroidales bacterium]|nr:hypothetical protein [Bacteroidales bacterium]HRW34373.1 hypothetical protein [Thermotogota bacterium]
MKRLFLSLSLLLIVSTMIFSVTFDLTGTWVASFERHEMDEGFLTAYDGRVIFVFERQEGHIFTGYKQFIDHSNDYESVKEPFSGLIDFTGKKLYCAEHTDGYLFGDIISENEITMYYVDSEESAIAVYYTLQKENTIPSLVGQWASQTVTRYEKTTEQLGKGFSGTYFITEQYGHIFTGYKLLKTSFTDEHREDLSGVISKDGKNIYIAEHNDGYAFADIIDANTIHLYYLEDTNLKTTYQILKRVE